MRILLTNDDGIAAPGLAVLEHIVQNFTDKPLETWVVAPETEQSGVGHALNYLKPYQICQIAPRRFAVSGTPADCVIAGVHHVMKETPPDLILAGVNRGNNSAENAAYSGTLGAALEGALQGIPAIALSQYLGPQTANLDNIFEASQEWGAQVVQKICAIKPQKQSTYSMFFNVNFPPVPAAQVKGLRVVPQGKRKGSVFSAICETAPNGRQFLWTKGGNQRIGSETGTDADVNLQGYISVTPMRADYTAHDAIDQFKCIE